MASSRRNWLILTLILGAIVVAFLAFGVFGVHTLFIDEEVSEAAPVFASAEATDDGAAQDPADETDASDTDENNESGQSGDDGSSDEDPGAGGSVAVEPTTSATGGFVDGAHPTSGTAMVLTDGGSRRVLRLEEDFGTDNGPDLNVYLASSADDFGGEFIDLGDLKGNIGSQNYEIPADVDLSVYDTVVIWCVRFGVGFGSAELMAT